MLDGIRQFMRHLQQLDADVVMFIARKSYCLYDTLVRLGYIGTDSPVVTDRMLDFDLRELRGKRVALVDDTVILGTTLARARARLIDVGAEVSIHALCVDEDFYSPDIVQLDHAELVGTDDFIKTFCAAEISALASLPRPYIVDFPISANTRIRRTDLGTFFSSIEWSTYKVDSPSRGTTDILAYTFFPSDLIYAELARSLGPDALACLDIVKVRAFGRLVDDAAWFSFVPIVTLQPLDVAGVERCARHIIQRLEESGAGPLDSLVGAIREPIGWLRITQYLLSSALGGRFLRSIASSIHGLPTVGFLDREAPIHFGPELGKRLESISAPAEHVVFGALSDDAPHIALNPAELPSDVKLRTAALFNDADAPADGIMLSSSHPSSGSIETDFSEIFLALFERYEIPARDEARRLGSGVLVADPEDAPFRDRLLKGIPWRSITEHLAKRYDTENDVHFRRLLSLILDGLNDLGISVPITCCEAGILYRAYRHGEDVPIHDGHLDLAFDAVDGILHGSGRDSLSRVALEKLLVLLFQLGISQGYILPKADVPSASRERLMLHRAFHLHGAIMEFRSRSSSASVNEIWFSKYLRRRNVLTLDSARKYQLGRRVDGSQVHSMAPAFAFGLGNIVGALMGGGLPGPAQTTDDLIALTTTRDARDTLAAIEAELVLFSEWWDEENGSSLRSAFSHRDLQMAAKLMTRLHRGNGYTAVNSALKKAHWYRTQFWRNVVDGGTSKLRHAGREGEARTWEGYWKPYIEAQTSTGGEALESAITQFAGICWSVGAWFAILEEGSVSQVQRSSSEKDIRNGAKKLSTWRARMTDASIAAPNDVLEVEELMESFRLSTLDERLSACRLALEKITTLRNSIDGAVSLVDFMLEEYGTPLVGQRYSYVLWYDLVDSKGNEWKEQDIDVETYRRRSFVFRRAANSQLIEMQQVARKKGGEVHPWKVGLSSADDEKHVAFGGRLALEWAIETLARLRKCAEAFPGVRFRAILIETNFVGTSLSRQHGGEMMGRSFLEHLSCLQQDLGDLEGSYLDSSCFVMVAGQGLIRSGVADRLGLGGIVAKGHPTEVEGNQRVTPVIYGHLSG
ncbi:phosphoribosyltransferase [Kribbella caucasensis]|nr:phosphoribosyltransferase [Kribbella sp. VKM Ac-2527]